MALGRDMSTRVISLYNNRLGEVIGLDDKGQYWEVTQTAPGTFSIKPHFTNDLHKLPLSPPETYLGKVELPKRKPRDGKYGKSWGFAR